MPPKVTERHLHLREFQERLPVYKVMQQMRLLHLQSLGETDIGGSARDDVGSTSSRGRGGGRRGHRGVKRAANRGRKKAKRVRFNEWLNKTHDAATPVVVECGG